jgi:hypothetical protein
MVRDYLTQEQLSDPWAFAEQYYLRYPKVAIGHWPPLFYLVQAVWLLILPPTQWSLVVLMGILGWTTGILFYLWARAQLGSVLALACATLLVLAAVVEESVSAVMADILSLLLGLLTTISLAHTIRAKTTASAVSTGVFLSLALLNKATGGLLVVAAGLVAVSTLRMRLALLVFASAAAFALPWYVLQYGFIERDVIRWAGVGGGWEWRRPIFLDVGGWGLAVLSALGVLLSLRRPRHTDATAAGPIFISACFLPLVVGAFAEPRHLLVAWPAAVWLAGSAVRSHPWVLSPVVVLALITFPTSPYVQPLQGFREAAAAVRARPSHHRMLVASPGIGEGQWIAALAFADKRRDRQVLRASKMLASMDWNRRGYEPLVSSAGEVAARLREWQVQLVILHQPSGALMELHQRLLETAVQSWPTVFRNASLRIVQRPEPLNGVRRPIEIDLRSRIGRILRE